MKEDKTGMEISVDAKQEKQNLPERIPPSCVKGGQFAESLSRYFSVFIPHFPSNLPVELITCQNTIDGVQY